MGFYILSYLCIAVFVVASGYRIYRQLPMPVHVCWEIYPVSSKRPLRCTQLVGAGNPVRPGVCKENRRLSWIPTRWSDFIYNSCPT